MSKDHGFTTLDAYIAGFLALKGFQPELIDQQGRIVFKYDNTPELQDALMKYNSGETVEAAKFALCVKGLKGRIFSIKNG